MNILLKSSNFNNSSFESSYKTMNNQRNKLDQSIFSTKNYFQNEKEEFYKIVIGPGKYDLPSLFTNKSDLVFPNNPKYSMRKRINFTKRYISKEHEEAGRDSPGAASYFPKVSTLKTKGILIGNEQRIQINSNNTPGPIYKYQTMKDTGSPKNYNHAHTIVSNSKKDFILLKDLKEDRQFFLYKNHSPFDRENLKKGNSFGPKKDKLYFLWRQAISYSNKKQNLPAPNAYEKVLPISSFAHKYSIPKAKRNFAIAKNSTVGPGKYNYQDKFFVSKKNAGIACKFPLSTMRSNVKNWGISFF